MEGVIQANIFSIIFTWCCHADDTVIKRFERCQRFQNVLTSTKNLVGLVAP